MESYDFHESTASMCLGPCVMEEFMQLSYMYIRRAMHLSMEEIQAFSLHRRPWKWSKMCKLYKGAQSEGQGFQVEIRKTKK